MSKLEARLRLQNVPEHITVQGSEAKASVDIKVISTAVSVFATNAYASEIKEYEESENDSDEIVINPYQDDRTISQDPGTFTFSRGEGNVDDAITVHFEVIQDTANPSLVVDPYVGDGDYENSLVSFEADDGRLIGTVIIPDGSSSVTVQIEPLDDEKKEWDESLRIELIDSDKIPSQAGESEDDEEEDDDKSGWYRSLQPEAEIVVFDNDAIGGLLDRNVDFESTGGAKDGIGNGAVSVDLQQGSASLAIPLKPDGYGPVYQGEDNLLPILSVEMQLPDATGTALPFLKATLTFAKSEAETISFTNAGAITSTDQNLRFVLLGPKDLEATLKSGHYDYDIQFETEWNGEELTRTIHGNTEIFNRVTDENQYGSRWWVAQEDQWRPDDGSSGQFHEKGHATQDGVAILRGDSTSAWFTADITSSTIKGTGSETGEWTTSTHESEIPLRVNEDGEGQFDWTFSNLNSGKMYQVFASWSPDVTRTEEARYEILNGINLEDPEEETIERIVSQNYTHGETVLDGMVYRSLGFFKPVEQSLNIKLSNEGEGELVASRNSVVLVDKWEYNTPDGSFSELTYDPQSSEFSDDPRYYTHTLEAKYGNRYEFNVDGNLHRHVDRNGNRTEFVYAKPENYETELQTITEQGGFKTTYVYTEDGVLDKILDFANRETDYQIGASVDTITKPDPGFGQLGNVVTSFKYDGPGGRLSDVTNARNFTASLAHNSETQRVISGSNFDDTSWEIRPQLTDGLLSRTIHVAASGKIGAADNAANGELREPKATFTDARTNSWTYQVDASGRTIANSVPATDKLPVQSVWETQRNEHGLVVKSIEPAGGGGVVALGKLTTEFEHDDKGNVESITFADDSTTSFEYHDEFSVLTQSTDQENRTTVYQVDSRGNVEFVIDQGGRGNLPPNYPALPQRTSKFAFSTPPASLDALPGGLTTDAFVAWNTDQQVHSKTEYFLTGTHLGLPEKTIQAVGTDIEVAVQYTYDDNRNPESVTDPLDRKVEFVYDNLDRLVKQTNPDPGTEDHGATSVEYLYDRVGNLTKLTDARNSVTDYQYDGENRSTITELPAPGGNDTTDQARPRTELKYDGNGNVIHQIVRRPTGEQSTDYTYDERNQNTKILYPDPGFSAADAKLTNPAEITRPTVINDYDTLGNVKSESDPRFGETNVIATRYQYDSLGRVKKVFSPSPTGAVHATTTTYEYYRDGNVKSVTTPSPGSQAFVTSTSYYDGYGRLAVQELPADGQGNTSITVTNKYDLRDNLTVAKQIGDITRTTLSFYDDLDRVTAVDNPDPSSTHAGTTSYFVYDNASQLR
ncbi:MAG: hypothetical protein AAF483_06780, partial [Planctomycetota bacterium]